MTEHVATTGVVGVRKRWFLAIIALALVARLLVVVLVIRNPELAIQSDAKQYLAVTRALYEYGRYSLDEQPPFTPTDLRPPGYPALLLLTFAVCRGLCPVLIVAIQAAMGVAVAAMVMVTAARLFGDAVGAVAGLLYALAPDAVIMTTFIMTESLFSLLLALALFGALLSALGDGRLWKYLIVGLLMGLAALTRPIASLLVPFVVIVVLLRTVWRQALLFGLLIVLGYAVVTGPWYLRNYRIFGQASLSSIAGGNLFYYNTASMEAYRLNINLEESRQLLAEELEGICQEEGVGDCSRLRSTIARRHIVAHPFWFLGTQVLDMNNSLRPGLSHALLLLEGDLEQNTRVDVLFKTDLGQLSRLVFSQSGFVLVLQLYLLVHLAIVLVLYAAGVISLLRLREWWLVVLLVLLPVWMLYMPGIASNMRFRVPVEPFLAIVGGLGATAIYRRVLRSLRLRNYVQSRE